MTDMIKYKCSVCPGWGFDWMVTAGFVPRECAICDDCRINLAARVDELILKEDEPENEERGRMH